MALDGVSKNHPEGGALICRDSQALLKAIHNHTKLAAGTVKKLNNCPDEVLLQ